MDNPPYQVSRRGLLIAAAAGSAIALAAPASALAAPHSTGPLVFRDRIGAALTHRPDGQAASFGYTVDLHDRLAEWQRFWWANAPGGWRAPIAVVGEVASNGRAFLLTAIQYTTAGKSITGFSATTTRNPAYWGTLASLHRFFPAVRPEASAIRVEDGETGFTGSPEQLSFIREARRQVWHGRPLPEITNRSSWHTFTSTTLRLGLGTESA